MCTIPYKMVNLKNQNNSKKLNKNYTGIGACELASTWMGWTNAFSCEYANQKIIGET